MSNGSKVLIYLSFILFLRGCFLAAAATPNKLISNYYRRSLVLLVGMINQSLYQEILLLQKFDDIRGKVLKPKIISLQPQKRMRPIFSEQTSQILEPSPQGLISSNLY